MISLSMVIFLIKIFRCFNEKQNIPHFGPEYKFPFKGIVVER